MIHFYDGQIRRYIAQLVRVFSNFSYVDGNGKETAVPITYGNITRQAATVLRDNSENKILSAPRMSLYITDLEMDRERTSDSSFVSKVHVRERALSEDGAEYVNTQGRNYTVERLMPAPYTLKVSLDIWTANLDQKLQILEPILTIFRPSLEIQTSDNYVDWTSLSVVNFEGMTFSTQSIPVGTDSTIDVAQLQFSTPIYISPPAKVKRLGVITNIITSIFEGTDSIPFADELTGSGVTRVTEFSRNLNPDLDYDTSTVPGEVRIDRQYSRYNTNVLDNPIQQRLYITDGRATLLENGIIANISWRSIIDILPGTYRPGLSTIKLRRPGLPYFVGGRVAINEENETELFIEWDDDLMPSNTVIPGVARSVNQQTSVDFIIDPQKFNPVDYREPGLRLLTLAGIGNSANAQGAAAWKNLNNSDFIAGANDIVEWTGSAWTVVWSASEHTADDQATFVTNLRTNTQYMWNGTEWLLSVDGEYAKNDWLIDLEG